MQPIPLAHTLAALAEVFGPFADVPGRFVSRFETVKVVETGEVLPETVPYQVMANSVLVNGAAVSIHYRVGLFRRTNLLWEINGTKGDIQVTAGSGHAQMAQLSMRSGRGKAAQLAPLDPPASAYAGWPDTPGARNVARIYARLGTSSANSSTSSSLPNAPTTSTHAVTPLTDRNPLEVQRTSHRVLNWVSAEASTNGKAVAPRSDAVGSIRIGYRGQSSADGR